MHPQRPNAHAASRRQVESRRGEARDTRPGLAMRRLLAGRYPDHSSAPEADDAVLGLLVTR